MKSTQQKPIRIKTLFFGSQGSGKSTFCQLVTKSKIIPQPTLGVDTHIIDKELNNQQVKVNIFDFSGDQQYKDVRNEFYNDGQAVIFGVDMSSKQSQLEINDYVQEIGSSLQQMSVFVVGLKADKQGAVQEADIAVLAQRLKGQFYITSTQEPQSVQESFEQIVKASFKKYTTSK